MRNITRLNFYQRGILLLDIMLALSLATLFIAILAESSSSARDLFNRARERDRLLDAFTISNQSTSTSITINQKERSYGNDRTETITTLFSNSGTTTDISKSFAPTISFSSVRIRPDISSNGFAGTSICSVDLSHNVTTGSFNYLNGINEVLNSAPNGPLNPKAPLATITAIPLPVNPLLPLTDLIVRDGIAYISSDSSKASDPDLFVIDIHDISNAAVLSSINTGPGISTIALAGKRVYAAADSTVAQLHIIRMDSLKNLILETKYKLPLPQASTSPPVASSIFYSNGYIYLGTTKWDGDELSVINVTDPINPTKIGWFETGSKINDIFVNGDTAYVAASDQQQLRVLDVHDHSNISLLNSFTPSGWQRQEGKALSLFENELAFGRTSGGFDIASDHELFSWASSSSVPLSSPSSANVPGGVYGIVSDRGYEYAATREVNKELRITNHELGTSTASYYSLPVQPQTITCDGNKLYILAYAAPVIYEVSF